MKKGFQTFVDKHLGVEPKCLSTYPFRITEAHTAPFVPGYSKRILYQVTDTGELFFPHEWESVCATYSTKNGAIYDVTPYDHAPCVHIQDDNTLLYDDIAQILSAYEDICLLLFERGEVKYVIK